MHRGGGGGVCTMLTPFLTHSLAQHSRRTGLTAPKMLKEPIWKISALGTGAELEGGGPSSERRVWLSSASRGPTELQSEAPTGEQNLWPLQVIGQEEEGQ